MRILKLALLAAVLTTATGCLSLKRDPREIALGARAPEPALLSTEGKPFPLGTLRGRGKPVLVFYRGRF